MKIEHERADGTIQESMKGEKAPEAACVILQCITKTEAEKKK